MEDYNGVFGDGWLAGLAELGEKSVPALLQ
jgi:hypothetical protein